MNIFLNEYFGFWFELNFELNHFSARFNEKMNFQNVSPTPTSRRQISRKLFSPMKFIRAITLVFGFITPIGGGLLEGNDCHC